MEELKSRKNIKLIGILLPVLAIFVWLFTIDRHPFISYHPTNGMAMLGEYAALAEKEDIEKSQSIDLAQANFLIDRPSPSFRCCYFIVGFDGLFNVFYIKIDFVY